MDQTKTPLKSLGIIGPLAAMIVLIANHIHPGLGLTDQEVAPAIDQIDALLGFATAIYGRWRATKQVSIIPQENKPNA